MSRDEKQQLLLGIRRANRQPNNISSSVLSSDSMHIGILAAAAHAAANQSPFTVFYNPRSVFIYHLLFEILLFHCIPSDFEESNLWLIILSFALLHNSNWQKTFIQGEPLWICYSFSQVSEGSLRQPSITRHAFPDDVWNRRIWNKKVWFWQFSHFNKPNRSHNIVEFVFYMCSLNNV